MVRILDGQKTQNKNIGTYMDIKDIKLMVLNALFLLLVLSNLKYINFWSLEILPIGFSVIWVSEVRVSG